jgi:hypothetical protein
VEREREGRRRRRRREKVSNDILYSLFLSLSLIDKLNPGQVFIFLEFFPFPSIHPTHTHVICLRQEDERERGGENSSLIDSLSSN